MKIKDHFLTGEVFELKETQYPGIYKTDPVPENIASYYESTAYISHHQDSGSLKEKIYKFIQGFNLNYKRNVLVAFLPKGAQVLDYGCGAGEFLKYIESDFTTYGLEPNPEAQTAAQKKTKQTTFIHQLQELQDESLDAITLWHVLEHIGNQQEILNLFHSKLRKNGKLIIAVPNPTSYDAIFYKEFWAAYDVPRHLYHFSKKGMEAFFDTDLWKLKTIKPLLLDSFYISMLSEKYKKSTLFWLKGAVRGAISNFKASKSGEFSSLIYVIEKK
ncbi:class I SAM-dependent methyltransferase [Chryseobacterium sp. MFBS3-17]|uniref:class I SAM-dependent methyltransferase n=1 Tax=Chryseobacterium sp. MFBS3-17 TaxID=2886689 RepID=UPI001D0E06F0|nr:class I SAM-dependent methyltransferase [Chryseobacterium sp. MFBS3-17]MCC2590418.1 class I SAM-dependent methyltransferase [Chryseobacterium sp. MFBS3-17]